MGGGTNLGAHTAPLHTRTHEHAAQVWDALNDGVLRFDARDAGARDASQGPDGTRRLGTLVENRVLQAALMEAMSEVREVGAGEPATSGGRGGGVTVYSPATVASLTLPPPAHIGGAVSATAAPAADSAGLPTVTLKDGTVVRARLLVGADGAASRVRSAAGIGVWGWDYDQRGVVATIKTQGAAGTAWQRFLPTGPLAILPVRATLLGRAQKGNGGGFLGVLTLDCAVTPCATRSFSYREMYHLPHTHSPDSALAVHAQVSDTHASIVWSTSPTHAAELERMAPEAFVAALNHALTAPRSEWERAHSEGVRTAAAPPPGDSGGGFGGGGVGDEHLYQRQRDMWTLNPLDALARWVKGVDGHIRSRYVGDAAPPDSPAASVEAPLHAFHPPPRVLELAGQRASFPLRLQNANTYVGPRLALIG